MRVQIPLLALLAVAACDSGSQVVADAAGLDARPLNCDAQVSADGRFDDRRGACYDARCFDDPESMAPCPTACETLDETTCIATAGCRVTYNVYEQGVVPKLTLTPGASSARALA